MADLNQYTITVAVQDSFRTEPGSRFDKLLKGLIEHVHDYVRETNLTQQEWLAMLDFLYRCGKISTPERHEFILLSDVLGLSAIVDMVNTRGGATEASNLGPFYLPDAPTKPLGVHLAPGREGVTVLVHGMVRDTLGKPLAGAVLDTWQADGTGTYPIQEEGQDKHDLRGVFTTGKDGRYWYTTVMPKPYTVPYDGPVGELLRAGDRHAWRAPHLHYVVRAPGYRDIVTEIFFEGSEYIDNDAVFGVRSSLIAKVEPVRRSDGVEHDLEVRPDAKFAFDFVLAPEG